MDLMTLAAKIQLDDSEYTKGVTKAEQSGQKLAKKMSAMTVAVGNLAADMIRKGVGAISSVITGAIDGYANYEQLIGGVQTLFKDSWNDVAENAKRSFKSTGLSANEYMETVTSFAASLVQGLGGDTQKAAFLADVAITDMADNANKMGTDIASIQAAYQGFAKQNYTMLDNLKLGYGGTREEMIRLINDSGILNETITSLDGITFDQIVQAIHVVQTQMGITGTTAKEAEETIKGSAASMGAAWSDLLTAIGGEGDQARLDQAMENFEASFGKYMENFIPTLITTVSNSGGLVTAIAEAVGELPTTLLADIGKEGVKSGAEMVRAVGNITGWMIDSMIEVFRSASLDNTSITDMGAAIGEFLGSSITKIVTNAGTIFQGILAVGKGLASGLVDGLIEGLTGDDTESQKIQDVMNEMVSNAEIEATKSQALISYLKELNEQYGAAAKSKTEWKEAVAELEQYIPDAGSVIEDFGSNIEGAISALDALADKMRETAINAALMGALQDSISLLAGQQVEYGVQKRTYERNKSLADSYKQAIIDQIQQEAMKDLKQMGDKEGLRSHELERYQMLENFINGLDQSGAKLKDLDLSVLWDFLGAFDIEKVDGKTLEDFQKLYGEANENMGRAKAAMEQSAAEIESTKQLIEDTKAAISDFSLGDSLGEAASDVESGGAEVGGALSSLAGKISAFQMPRIGWQYMPKATGIDYVPYSGFRAELHRGETVLTKAEADRYRNGAGTAEVVGAIQSLNSNIQNMELVVGQKTFGRAVVNYGGTRMRNHIGQAESRYWSGYGT